MFKKIYDLPLTKEEAEKIAQEMGGTAKVVQKGGMFVIVEDNGNARYRNPQTRKLTMGNINQIPN
ncbi:MAG: hypothetical protein LBO09_08910 [Candidatus Peribacteria bacterium]|jgi:hypothetical protein|nr:hypothetical protein [Candidatus Peribacteria bacterium]